MRKERQDTGLAGRVRDQARDQRRFDAVPGVDRGLRDGLPEFFGGHRADQDLRVLHGFGEFRVLRAVRVEIGADAEHDPDAAGRVLGRGDQRRQEAVPLLDVRAEREHLFELVDDQDDIAFAVGHQLAGGQAEVGRVRGEVGEHRAGREPQRRGELDGAFLQRPRARRHQDRRRGRHGRDQPGTQHRRLARTGSAENGEKTLSRQSLGQLFDKAFTAEEAPGVLRPECGQTDVRRLFPVRLRFGMTVTPVLLGHGVPALLPLGNDTAAGADVCRGDRETGQFPPARRLGQRPGGVMRATAQLAIGRIPGLLTQPPQIRGEFGERVVAGFQRLLRTRHRPSPPVASHSARSQWPRTGESAFPDFCHPTGTSASRATRGKGTGGAGVDHGREFSA